MKKLYVKCGNRKTYVKIVGEEYHATPIIFLHGGPGQTHDVQFVLAKYVDVLKRPMIFYDPYGSGKSKPIFEHDGKNYRLQVWVDELANLMKKLGYSKYILLGHSFGGMVVIKYMCDTCPDNVEKVILSSTLSSIKLWKEEAMRLAAQLEPKTRKDLLRMYHSDLPGSLRTREEIDAYLAAYDEYLQKYVFDDIELIDDSPFNQLAYESGWGEDEMSPAFYLEWEYEYTDLLSRITVPTLVISGKQDESTPLINKEIYDHLGSVCKKQVLIDAKHFTYLKETETFVKSLKEFL